MKKLFLMFLFFPILFTNSLVYPTYAQTCTNGQVWICNHFTVSFPDALTATDKTSYPVAYDTNGSNSSVSSIPSGKTYDLNASVEMKEQYPNITSDTLGFELFKLYQNNQPVPGNGNTSLTNSQIVANINNPQTYTSTSNTLFVQHAVDAKGNLLSKQSDWQSYLCPDSITTIPYSVTLPVTTNLHCGFSPSDGVYVVHVTSRAYYLNNAASSQSYLNGYGGPIAAFFIRVVSGNVTTTVTPTTTPTLTLINPTITNTIYSGTTSLTPGDSIGMHVTITNPDTTALKSLGFIYTKGNLTFTKAVAKWPGKSQIDVTSIFNADNKGNIGAIFSDTNIQQGQTGDIWLLFLAPKTVTQKETIQTSAILATSQIVGGLKQSPVLPVTVNTSTTKDCSDIKKCISISIKEGESTPDTFTVGVTIKNDTSKSNNQIDIETDNFSITKGPVRYDTATASLDNGTLFNVALKNNNGVLELDPKDGKLSIPPGHTNDIVIAFIVPKGLKANFIDTATLKYTVNGNTVIQTVTIPLSVDNTSIHTGEPKPSAIAQASLLGSLVNAVQTALMSVIHAL